MKPMIDLTAADLETPSRLSLSRLEGIMLWPDDAAARERAAATAASQFIRDAVRDRWAPMPEGHADLADVLGIIAAGDRVADAVQRDAKARFFEGALVGYTICNLIGEPKNGAATTLKESKRRALEKLRGIAGRNFDMKRVDNVIWPRFRPVGHLWAAYFGCSTELQDRTFPCRLADLSHFLAVSEALLQVGSTWRASRAPVALLDKATAWRPAEEIAPRLPRI